jgi:hypothetical protein
VTAHRLRNTELRYRVYVTTDGQLASPPRIKAPIWGPRQDFHHCQTVAGRPMRGATPTRGRSRRPQPLSGLASAVNLVSESCQTSDGTSLFQIRDFHFFASHDSQGYGGGTRTRLHMGLVILIFFFLIIGSACDIITCVSLVVFDPHVCTFSPT